MNNFGFELEELLNDQAKTVGHLGSYLNSGHLGLLLGSGVSAALKLPTWDKLVFAIHDEVFPGIRDSVKFYSNAELKELIDDVKDKLAHSDYLEKIKKFLYDEVDFDFSMAKKELLIAISSLIVGKHRGNVRNIITYNFDSVLEWYLNLLGLQVDVFTKAQFLTKSADVIIAHIHGYLPFDGHGKNSKEIIFASEEFTNRMLSNDYWKEYFYEFFRRHTFLALGMSAESLVKDVCPYLAQMDIWYKHNELTRGMPYGVAFVSSGAKTEKHITKLLASGIIPILLDKHEDLPVAIFEIVQSALSQKNINSRS
ncbi:hypothetical protein ASE74_23535 [Pedobacter sp. Leaf216]|uniref:SIR2 family protein n=1 Tax=Pedobacter sp. Leaf216 TaxID=1735684 RepID=UPI0006FC1189|nr:SIR2 family protein [Pedobacter sp. Leaf216]KQM70356.1 hypothetical protein ASE74_23535 [Pedobacter sp. Leaf216]